MFQQTAAVITTNIPVLYIALELSNSKWKLLFSTGLGHKPRERTIEAGDLEGLDEEISKTKKRFDLPEEVRVVCCYEAGRDGFWLSRYLSWQGIENYVLDPRTISSSRGRKGVKTDRVDAHKLLRALIEYHQLGDRDACGVVHVPGVEEEDHRELHRELRQLKKERTQHSNRIRSFLIKNGIRLGLNAEFLEELEKVRLWDGSELPPEIKARIRREYERLMFVQGQIRELEKKRRELLKDTERQDIEQVHQLQQLKSIGDESSWIVVMEFLGWRKFNNRREIASLAGLTPTPSQSGDRYLEKGLSKAGNRYIRGLMIEIAWLWIRYQPRSKLTLWFQERFGSGSKRIRKIGIVALARKLLIALWRYVDQGIIPEGAELKGC